MRFGVDPAVTAGRVRSATPGEQTGSGLWITSVGTGPGWELMTTSADTGDVHPPALVTVKLYEPGFSPFTVKVVPEALTMILPGKRVSVHVPVAGRPPMTTLPVGRSHVGWVIAPGTGGVGIDGFVSKVKLCDGIEVQPPELVTVNV